MRWLDTWLGKVPRGARELVAGLVALALTWGLAGCRSEPPPEPITVYAASSLTDVLRTVADEYVAAGGPRPSFRFAGSGTLAKQIAAGAPADLVISADRQSLDGLVERGLVAPNSSVRLARNTLVVVVPLGPLQSTASSSAAPEVVSSPPDEPGDEGVQTLSGPWDLLYFDHIVIADPQQAPAGAYAMRWFESSGVVESLRPRLVLMPDARAAMAAVASRRFPVGLVYSTDAQRAVDRVRVLHRVAAEGDQRVDYYLAPVSSPEAGRGIHPGTSFTIFLSSPRAQEIFAEHGFLPPAPGRFGAAETS